MIKNEELFKKLMFSIRKIGMKAINDAVAKKSKEGEFEEDKKSSKNCRKTGKGMAREHLLICIADSPDGMWQKKISEEAGINASTTSELIKRLEEDGYIACERDAKDKRAVKLTLTEAGKARADEIRVDRDIFLSKIFSKFTDEEKQALSDLLDKFTYT